MLAAIPVWVASKIVGVGYPTLGRSTIALVIGLVGAITSAMFAGGAAILLVPLSFLLSFKFVLDTSFFGAIILSIIAATGFTIMIHFFGGGLSAISTNVSL